MARHPSRPWNEIDAQIIGALDLRAEYQQLGVEITGREPNADGWIECRAVDREDRTPSAAVNVRTGRYHDFGGEGLSLSLWDFTAQHNSAAGWQEARRMFAKKAGVRLPGGRPPKRPDDNLEFLQWSTTLVKQWCASKPPISPEAVKAVGGRVAKYRDQYVVVALPVFGPKLLDADPCGWVLFEISGQDLPIFHKGKAPTSAKMKTTAGSRGGIMGTVAQLVGAGSRTVWKTEGPTDALALLMMIPSDDRDKFLIVTNSGGAAEHPRLEIVKLFSGHKVIVIHDADRPGQIGAERWAGAIVQVATEARNVKLPYETEPKHGRDLRDYFADGHTFADLLKLVEQTEPAKLDEVRPEIIDGTDEARVIDQAVAALATEPNMFQRAGMLVQVVRDADPPRGIHRPKDAPRIAPLRLPRLRELLASAADWKRPGSDDELFPCHPPQWAVKAVDARGQWTAIRRLEGVVESPTLRADGTVLQTSGYDETTGLLYAPQVVFPEIPAHPTLADAEHGRDVLQEVVEDFPFASDAHRAAWVASTLTPLARFAYHGPAPLFLIDANVRGCGKTLLTDVTAMIVSGRGMARMTAPADDSEFRKRITALAVAGEPLVLIDNAAGTLGCPSLDAALTATTWTDRVLGRTEMIRLPLTATWYVTTNNAILEADTARRTLHIRLESPEENPEERSDFHHLDLLAWVRRERPRLTTATITILQAYCTAGKPDMKLNPWGSFEAWSDLVRQAVVWCGLPDPAATRTELASQADREGNALRQLIDGWQLLDPDGDGLPVADVLRGLEDFRKDRMAPDADAYDLIDNALCELIDTRGGKLPSANSVGMKLHYLCRRVVGGKHLDRKTGNLGNLWFVVARD